MECEGFTDRAEGDEEETQSPGEAPPSAGTSDPLSIDPLTAARKAQDEEALAILKQARPLLTRVLKDALKKDFREQYGERHFRGQ